jgi:hypothetical protein
MRAVRNSPTPAQGGEQTPDRKPHEGRQEDAGWTYSESHIFFDLDGTPVDPREGIVGSMRRPE